MPFFIGVIMRTIAFLFLIFLAACSSNQEPTKPKPLPSTPDVTVPSVPTKGPAKPSVDSTWALSYYGKFVDHKVDYYILDLWNYDPRELPKHSKYIAYFSMHKEDWRPDADRFKKEWTKGPWKEWDGEYLMHPSNFHKAIPIMKDRIDLAVKKGFIGIDMDNVDQPWVSDRSSKAFKEAKKAMADYWNTLADYARSKGLLVGQKNASRYSDVLKDPDFYMVEQCHQYNECHKYAGKGIATFVLEYYSSNCKPYPGAYVVYKKNKKMVATNRKLCN